MENEGLKERNDFLGSQIKARGYKSSAKDRIEVSINGVEISCFGEIQPKDVECGLLHTDMKVDRIEVDNPLDLLVNGVTLVQLNDALRNKLN